MVQCVSHEMIINHCVSVCLFVSRYGPVNPVKHIKVQRNTEGMYFLVECKMFRTIPVSPLHSTKWLLSLTSCQN